MDLLDAAKKSLKDVSNALTGDKFLTITNRQVRDLVLACGLIITELEVNKTKEDN